MYYPFMRGKMYELIILRDLFGEDIFNNKLVPIIEPVNITGRSHVKSYNEIIQMGKPFVLICNPENGPHNLSEIKINLIDTLFEGNTFYSIGILISRNITLTGIEEIINQFQDFNIVLIHKEESLQPEQLFQLYNRYENVTTNIHLGTNRASYQTIFEDSNRVLIEDGFYKADRNADYPSETLFSNLHSTFKPEYQGFGDFMIVGDNYSDSGGPAHAVTIHFTHFNDQNMIVTKHFVSDRTKGEEDVPGKYGEAHQKLVNFLNSNTSLINTDGARELIDMHEFRGLGYLKKLCMKHHIELVCSKL